MTSEFKRKQSHFTMYSVDEDLYKHFYSALTS